MKPKTLDIGDSKGRRSEKKEFAAKIGKHLRVIRKSKKISQEDLSEKAGYYRTYVGKIEQGLYSPSTHTIWRLSHALGMSLSDFFRGF
ncbi:MAG: helix-turn-helix transcriptional regulator [Candidatus Daviesbacteria bacterium]|nr:helix-turn-helix transcriptional regulator [Candidatus Daviesbacteria bacterium]